MKQLFTRANVRFLLQNLGIVGYIMSLIIAYFVQPVGRTASEVLRDWQTLQNMSFLFLGLGVVSTAILWWMKKQDDNNDTEEDDE